MSNIKTIIKKDYDGKTYSLAIYEGDICRYYSDEWESPEDAIENELKHLRDLFAKACESEIKIEE